MNRDFDALVKEATAGSAEAQFALGRYYVDQTDKNLAESVKWFAKAADQDHPGGQYELGVAYCSGRGAGHNEENALLWLTRSAEQGYPKAQHNLGVRHSFGKGVPKDAVKAVEFFHKAAAQEHALSQFKLAVMYKLGWGVDKDEVESDRLFQLSGDTGRQETACDLSELANRRNDRASWFKEAIKHGYTGREF